jgi:hypothetical protein
MFSRVRDPVIRITTKGITFNACCVSRLPGASYVELLFNPVERMLIVRPCKETHPNAIPWDAKYKTAAPLTKVIYDSMGWEADYSFRVPCQTITNPDRSNAGSAVLAFDLDNYVGRANSKKDETIIPQKNESAEDESKEEAKSFFYPPDEDEPQEIQDMEEAFQKAVEINKKFFGTPVFEHDPGTRGLDLEGVSEAWDMMAEARPLDINHTIDSQAVDDLLLEIMEDPPVLAQPREDYAEAAVVIEGHGGSE